MSFANGLINTVRAALTFDGNNPKDPNLAKLFGFTPQTKSGKQVTGETVVGLPAVMRGVNIIANGVAKVPFYVMKTSDDWMTQDWDRSHPSWAAITRQANPRLCDGEFRRTMTAWALLYGNAVAKIERPNWPDGPVELYPLLPDRTRPFLVTDDMIKTYNLDRDLEGELYFETIVGGQTISFPATECLHIKGLGPNAYWGYDIIEVLREAWGGFAASAEFGNRFFGQGANPAGVITMPMSMDENSEANFRDSIRRGAEGLGNAHRFMILEEGADFKPMTIDPQRAQFIEGREFDVRLIAMCIGIKVHKLIDSANTSFKSLEQANQEHKEDDLMPWIDRWREELSAKLLTEEQQLQETHKVDVDDEYLEWAPFADRASGVVEIYNNGLCTKEEGRRRLNFGKSDSRNGDRFRMPSNIIFEDDAETFIQSRTGPGRPPEPDPQDDSPEDDTDDEEDSEPDDGEDDETNTLIQEMREYHLERVAKRLANQATRTAAKGGAEFVAWVDSLDTEHAPKLMQSGVDKLYESLKQLLAQVAETTSEDELKSTVERVASEWLEQTKENSDALDV